MTYRITEPDLEYVHDREPFMPPAIASIDEIRYAHQLRLQLRERYPDLPSPPPPFWCIGID